MKKGGVFKIGLKKIPPIKKRQKYKNILDGVIFSYPVVIPPFSALGAIWHSRKVLKKII